MHFLSEDLENYANEHTDNEPILLQELSKRTHLTVLQPRMISGHLQGRFLSLLSKMIHPKNYLRNWYLYRICYPLFSRRITSKWGITYY